MKKALAGALVALSLGIGAMTATPALADPPPGRGWNKHGNSHPGHGPDRRDGYRAPPHMVYVYDYDRPDPRWRGYYPDRYYRGGYEPIPMTRSMRIYRGGDGRYYCRRSDGTTGLIIGAAVGGLIGNRLDRGESGILGTIIGASTGALLGRELDRGSMVCR